MTDGQRRNKVERLHCRRDDLEPGAVVPERKFDGFELRAVREAAGVPSECLRSVVVSVEFVDRGSVVPRRGKVSPTTSAAIKSAALAALSIVTRSLQ